LADSIPFYGLYGEVLTDSEPGFVHIESIAERSSRTGWHIQAHRHHNLVQMLIVEQGRAEVFVDNQMVTLETQGMIFLPTEVVHGFEFEPDTLGSVLSIATPFANEVLDMIRPEVNVTHLSVSGVLSLSGKPDLMNTFIQIRRLIEGEFRRQRQYSHTLLKCLLGAFLTAYLRASDLQQIHSNQTNHANLLQTFMALLETNYKTHYRLDWYAEQLNISLSTLNRICNTTLGKSGKKLQDERLLLEAKRRLIYTLDSIENIAFSLGYEDPAYFSRFFTKYTKASPGRYRKAHSQTS
jgi:AraC family transcriptional regulator, transcriptional activator of pobA